MGSKKIKLNKNLNINILIKRVPYYSQYLDVNVIDKKGRIYKNIVDGYWFKRACGILSLKMVMDYWGRFLVNYKKKPIMSLIWTGLSKNAFSELAGGWYHRGLLEVAKDYGFQGRLFDWSGLKIENEKILLILKNILKNQKPIIVSIYKNFNNKKSGHLIVLVGYRVDEFGNLKGFYFNDPASYSKISKKYAFVKKNKFLNGWKKRAILIWPRKIKIKK